MKPLLLLFSFLFTLFSSAQTRISGTVRDGKNKPLAGVSIGLKDTYDGATSDSLGHFSFTTSEKGAQVLTASLIGYRTAELPVNMTEAIGPMALVLKEEVTELKAVVISAGAFEASDRKKGTVLSAIDIATTASGNGDVTGALKTLPGTQQVGESEGLFVRGGTAAETKTFIDGTLVNNFFFSSVPNVAQRSRFSPFIFKGTVFSTGGYSALYGQALSSALILESIDLPEETSANVGISVIGLSGGYQQLAKNKKWSWGGNYSYSDLRPAFAVIKQQQEFFKTPLFHNADANFRIKTSETGMLKYYGYFNWSDLGFTTNSLDTLGFNDLFRLRNDNTYHNLSYREVLGRGWKINIGASATYNRDTAVMALANGKQEPVLVQGMEYKNMGWNNRSTFFNSKVVLEKRLRGLSAMRMGAEYNRSKEDPQFTLYNGEQFGGPITDALTAAFAEADVYLTNSLAAKLGTRAEHSSLLDRANIAPRLSLAYKLGNNGQASLAYGQFYQNPETRYLNGPSSLLFTKATHYIAQYQRIASDRTLRLELFYKDYDHLVKTRMEQNRGQAINNGGFGYAKGFEAFWRDKKTVRNLDYWVSYSFLDTKRNFLDYPTSIQPNFAARHTASVVVKRFVTAWKTGFNAAYNYSSPRPFFFIAPDGAAHTKFVDRGETPPYHNVSFSLNYLPSLGKANASKFTVLVLSVSNIFGFDQEFGRRYSFNGQRFEPILPPSRRFIFIGAFISFGVDRSQEVINSNL
jgi:hypothetical protein